MKTTQISLNQYDNLVDAIANLENAVAALELAEHFAVEIQQVEQIKDRLANVATDFEDENCK